MRLLSGQAQQACNTMNTRSLLDELHNTMNTRPLLDELRRRPSIKAMKYKM
jgi:hypothetical protein